VAKYHSIRDEVLDLIAELRVGDALPAERALSQSWSV
jgi:GntR family transcriptional regulator